MSQLNDEEFDNVLAYAEKYHGSYELSFDTSNTAQVCTNPNWNEGQQIENKRFRSLQECNAECILNPNCKSYKYEASNAYDVYPNLPDKTPLSYCALYKVKCEPKNPKFSKWGLYTDYKNNGEGPEMSSTYLWGSKSPNLETKSSQCENVMNLDLIQKFDGLEPNTAFLSWNARADSDNPALPPTMLTERTYGRAQNYKIKYKDKAKTFIECHNLCLENDECKSFRSSTNGKCELYRNDCTGNVIIDNLVTSMPPPSGVQVTSLVFDLQEDERQNIKQSGRCVMNKTICQAPGRKIYREGETYNCNPRWQATGPMSNGYCSHKYPWDRESDQPTNAWTCGCHFETKDECENATISKYKNGAKFRPCAWEEKTEVPLPEVGCVHFPYDKDEDYGDCITLGGQEGQHCWPSAANGKQQIPGTCSSKKTQNACEEVQHSNGAFIPAQIYPCVWADKSVKIATK